MKKPEYDYEPLHEIVIHIGEVDPVRVKSTPIRVYFDGEQINKLRGFDFHCHVDEIPTMTMEQYI